MKLRTLLARAKRRLFKKPFLEDKRYPAFWFDLVLGEEEAFVLQIGSNDGKTGDPIYPLLQKNKNWKALFVEPVPGSFEKLKANYPDPNRFRFENVAINEGQKMTFYWVDPKAVTAIPDLPYWFDQLGSFDEEHILKHFDGQLAPYIISRELEGVTLSDLLQRNQIDQIDLLHIDTEGYDWKILSQLELDQLEPVFILYEQNHLSDMEKKASIQFLQEKYELFGLPIDIMAVHKKLKPDLIDKMGKYIGNKLTG